MTTAVTAPVPEIVPISELRKHPDNPRRGDVDTLRGLIRENGWVGTVYRQQSTGYVLSGWHSSQAAAAEGYEALPVVTLDVDDRRALKLLISLNRGHEVGHTDEDDLAMVLRVLAEDDDLEGSGFVEDDVDELLRASGAFGDDAAGFLDGIGDEDAGAGGDDEDGDADGDGATPPAPSPSAPVKPDADQPVYFQLAYTLTLPQRQTVLDAIAAARKVHGDETPSAQLLTEICAQYLDEG